MVRILTIAAAVMILCAPAARAANMTIGGTVVDDQGQFSSVVGAATIDFNSAPTGTQNGLNFGIATFFNVNIFTCACSGVGDLLDDTTRGARAMPGAFFSVQFAQPISYFGFYWGSPDSNNGVALFNGATPVTGTNGTALAALGVQEGISGAAYVNFFAGPGEEFTSALFFGGSFPFETDNHAYVVAAPVPEPTSLLLLGSGAAGFLLRRRVRPARKSP